MPELDVDSVLDALRPSFLGDDEETADASNEDQSEQEDLEDTDENADADANTDTDESEDDDSPPGEEDIPVDEELDDLRHSLKQIEDDIETLQSKQSAAESERDELDERIDTIEDHNVKLLGIYDRLTPGVNPFADDWDPEEHEFSTDSDSPYNVVSPPEDDSESHDTAESEDVTTYDDLKEEDPTEDETVEEDTQTEEVQQKPSTTNPSVAPPHSSESPARAEGTPNPNAGNAYLSVIPDSYAADVLLMEWLTELVETAGAEGALKTIDYYERINWISDPVKRRLEDLLSGMNINKETPTREPSDLTTSEHNESYAYLVRITQLRVS